MSCNVIGTTNCLCAYENKKEKLDCLTAHSLVRFLFSNHSWYTQDYIVAVIFKLPTAPALRARLLQNQTDIGRELGDKFSKIGPDTGKRIGDFLTNHIAKAEAAVVAAIEAARLAKLKVNLSDEKAITDSLGANEELKKAKYDLFEQGDEMSDYLASVLELNTNNVEDLFHEHNQQVLNLTTLLLLGNYGSDYIKELDEYQNHMMYIADIIYSAAEAEEHYDPAPYVPNLLGENYLSVETDRDYPVSTEGKYPLKTKSFLERRFRRMEHEPYEDAEEDEDSPETRQHRETREEEEAREEREATERRQEEREKARLRGQTFMREHGSDLLFDEDNRSGGYDTRSQLQHGYGRWY